MYVVLVPVFGLFLGRKGSAQLWVSMAIAVVGLYLLCMKDGFGSIQSSDWLLLLCAVLFSFQIMAVDHFSPQMDGVRLSLVEFFVVSVESTVAAFCRAACHGRVCHLRRAHPVLRHHVQRRGLHPADSGSAGPEPRRCQPDHVSGKRIQRLGRLAAAAPEPFYPGIYRLRAAVCRRGAGTAAPWPPDAEQGLRWRQSRARSLRSVEGIQYELVRKKVKQLHLRVRSNGTVMVSIPLTASLEQADRFVLQNAQWIRDTRVKNITKRNKDNADLPDKATALTYFTAMSDKVYPAFAGVLGGQKPVLKVRSMTSRWGVCCPGKRQITFALQLYNQPPAAQIYVVVHEYCHFLQLNHSPAFWAEVEKLLPDWKARRELLKK